MKKTILLVAMPDSIHVARWIKQIDKQKWDIQLFPSTLGTIHPEMDCLVHHSKIYLFIINIYSILRDSRIGSVFFPRIPDVLWQRLLEILIPDLRIRQLVDTIRRIRPHLVHSMEIQAAGYLTLESKERFPGKFPPWLVTNWGSDIFLFGRLQQHQKKIREVLSKCDYYSCECERDVRLAKQFGFTGSVMPVFPNTGGFDLSELESERNKIRTSARKKILLKGYQNWAGRALVGLRALSRCKDVLSDYEVIIYSASPEVSIAAELFSESTKIPVRIIPKNTPHRDMLSLHAQARISIGLSISDAISTSFLEAIVMGSFPIQTFTACVDEWIENGLGGMIVSPEDPDLIEIAIRRALSDDKMVDEAAEINWDMSKKRLDEFLIKELVNGMYEKIFLGE